MNSFCFCISSWCGPFNSIKLSSKRCFFAPGSPSLVLPAPLIDFLGSRFEGEAALKNSSLFFFSSHSCLFCCMISFNSGDKVDDPQTVQYFRWGRLLRHLYKDSLGTYPWSVLFQGCLHLICQDSLAIFQQWVIRRHCYQTCRDQMGTCPWLVDHTYTHQVPMDKLKDSPQSVAHMPVQHVSGSYGNNVTPPLASTQSIPVSGSQLYNQTTELDIAQIRLNYCHILQ
jgi:hypothetical protein